MNDPRVVVARGIEAMETTGTGGMRRSVKRRSADDDTLGGAGEEGAGGFAHPDRREGVGGKGEDRAVGGRKGNHLMLRRVKERDQTRKGSAGGSQGGGLA